MEETQTKSDWPAKSPIGTGQWAKIKRKYHLSPRELQVCIAICRGCNNKQVAEKLVISEHTVESHVDRIFRKVGVKLKIMLLLRFLET